MARSKKAKSKPSSKPSSKPKPKAKGKLGPKPKAKAKTKARENALPPALPPARVPVPARKHLTLNTGDQLDAQPVKCTMVLSNGVITKLDEVSIAYRKRGKGALQRSEILRVLVEVATVDEILEAVDALRDVGRAREAREAKGAGAGTEVEVEEEENAGGYAEAV